MCHKPLITFLYGQQYLDNTGNIVFIIYVLVDMFKIFNLFTIVSSNKKGHILTIISLISLLVNIGLNLLLFSLIGLIGIALSTLISTLFNCFTIFFVAKKYSGVRFSKLLDYKFLIAYMAVVSLSMVIVGVINFFLAKIGIHDVVILIISFSFMLLSLGIAFFKFFKSTINKINNLN